MDRNGGYTAFGVVQIGLDCCYSQTGARLTFHGSDEGAESNGNGNGDADLEPNGTLSGEINFHNGDDMPFVARRW